MSALKETTQENISLPKMTAELNPEIEKMDEVLLDILFSDAEKFVLAENPPLCH